MQPRSVAILDAEYDSLWWLSRSCPVYTGIVSPNMKYPLRTGLVLNHAEVSNACGLLPLAPSYHPAYFRIFHEINHPAIGSPISGTSMEAQPGWIVAWHQLIASFSLAAWQPCHRIHLFLGQRMEWLDGEWASKHHGNLNTMCVWWSGYVVPTPSEKYESQLGLLFPICEKSKAFRTTNQVYVCHKRSSLWQWTSDIWWPSPYPKWHRNPKNDNRQWDLQSNYLVNHMGSKSDVQSTNVSNSCWIMKL